MKGYVTLLAAAAILLLLIPLPALGHAPADPTPPPTTEDTTTVETTQTPAKQEDAPVFKMLCGDEVVTLDDRDFLIRTLAMEMPASYHEEALKAQAVAAYTYYHRRRVAQQNKADPDLKGADFVTPNDAFPQNYDEESLRERWGENYDEYYEKIAAAVDAVWGQTITYDGALIDACFHAMSNGQTETAKQVWGAEVPYLQAAASPGDTQANGYRSTATFTPQQVRDILSDEKGVSLSDDPAEWFGKPTLSDSGTVASQSVGGKKIAGTRVRTLFGLRSASYSVTYENDTFTFSVRGYGHGVGMSQNGADCLAREGYSYKEILKHYYAGVTIE
ncbi:MAG: stage II sporulation protein D [Clostridia bacterium]|nr:stage II sporulation protein D [Clostridia bacterium]